MGSEGHEEQDAKTFADWGVDYLKYDWCSATGDQKEVFGKMGRALKKVGRPIVYAVCQYGMDKVWKWGPEIGGHLWRTTMDIKDNYDRMSVIGFAQNGLERFAGPGHWNDPDMLEVGNGGMNLHEYRTHMALWAILAAPLIAGNDVRNMNQETIDLLTNPDVIAIDQDPAGTQGYRIAQEGPLETWMRPLADGSTAIALFNRAHHTQEMTLQFSDAGLPERVAIRDLWLKRDIGEREGEFKTSVPGHGVSFLRIRPAIRMLSN